MKSFGTIVNIYKSTNGHFYATVHTRPNVQSNHKLTNRQAIALKVGQKVETDEFWRDKEFNVELVIENV